MPKVITESWLLANGVDRATLAAAPARCYEPGEVVAQFAVEGRAIPWKVSIRKAGKGPPTNPKLAAWQRQVKAAARLAMADRPPHSGRFALMATFRLRRTRWKDPDLCNLAKGLEDAMEGVIFVNDSEADEHRTMRVRHADADGVEVAIVAL